MSILKKLVENRVKSSLNEGELSHEQQVAEDLYNKTMEDLRLRGVLVKAKDDKAAFSLVNKMIANKGNYYGAKLAPGKDAYGCKTMTLRKTMGGKAGSTSSGNYRAESKGDGTWLIRPDEKLWVS